MYSKRELLNWLWDLGDGQNTPPSQADLHDDPNAPSPGTYHYRFESWQGALEDAGYSPVAVEQQRASDTSRPTVFSDAELIRILQSRVDDLGSVPSSRDWMDLDDVPSVSTYMRRFDSWNAALQAAGFEPIQERDTQDQYSDEDLLKHIRKLSDQLGTRPSQTDLAEADGPSRWAYMDRFGSWSRAKQLAFDSER